MKIILNKTVLNILNLLLLSRHLFNCKALTEMEILSKFHQDDYKLKFERIEVANFSKEVFSSVKAVNFKYNRTTALTNFTLSTAKDINDTLSIIIQAFNFLSNEYRIYPIHFQTSYHNSIKMKIAGIYRLVTNGNFSKDCKFKKGETYIVNNYAPDANRFPPYIPNGDYKLELNFMYEKKSVLCVYNFVTIYRPILP